LPGGRNHLDEGVSRGIMGPQIAIHSTPGNVVRRAKKTRRLAAPGTLPREVKLGK
jgi:hypothetical protein